MGKFRINKYYIITLDSSVPNGLEFVSAPMSFIMHLQIIPLLFDWLKQFEIRNSEKTGFHIHIDKRNINSDFINWFNNYMLNTKEVDIFAGRKENKFCKRNNRNNRNNKTSATRITENTLEIRIFSSFLDYENVIQRIYIIYKLLFS